MFHRARQAGVTLIEVLAGLGVLAMVLTGLALLMNSSIEDVRGQQVAQHQHRLARAVGEWMLNPLNRDDVIATASLVAPRVLDINADLGQYLPPNFSDRNSFNQQACVRAYYDSGSDRIEIVISTAGGAPIDDALLGYTVGHAGPGAGGVYSNDPAIARGAYGNWSAPVAAYPGGGCGAPTAGHLVSIVPFDNSGTAHLGGAGEWLSRMEVPGRPELNRMSTAIDMNEYDINRILNAEVLESVFVGEDVFADKNVHAGINVTAGNNMYVGNDVDVAQKITAGNDIAALNGDMLATNGRMVSQDYVSTAYTASSGRPVKASEAVTYGTIVDLSSFNYVRKPICTSGSPQIFVTPAAYAGGSNAMAGGAYAYATNYSAEYWTVHMLVLAVTPSASRSGSTITIGFSGNWTNAPAGSKVHASTKCSAT